MPRCVALVICGIAVAVGAALLPVAPPSATAAEIAEVTVQPSRVTVGDRITLTIVVEHEEGTTVQGPGFGADFGGLEVIEIPPPRAEPTRTAVSYVLAGFRTGAYTVPPLGLSLSGAERGTLVSPEQRIVIESVLQPGDTELRPLKPQLEIPQSAPPPVIPGLFVALFAALTAFGYVLMRRAIAERPVAAPAAPAQPPPPPHERAAAALAELQGASLADGDLPEHYFRIAAIIRAYLSERFAFPAYAMTRTEIEEGMTARGIDRWPARLAANLLEQCEAVEFAGFRPAAARVDADLSAAYEIIELTREPEPPSSDEGDEAT